MKAQKYSFRKGLIFQKRKDELVIFDGEKSILYQFNQTASYIYFQLKKGLSEKDIFQNLSQKYSIPKVKAKNDTKILIKDLMKKGIINKINNPKI